MHALTWSSLTNFHALEIVWGSIIGLEDKNSLKKINRSSFASVINFPLLFPGLWCLQWIWREIIRIHHLVFILFAGTFFRLFSLIFLQSHRRISILHSPLETVSSGGYKGGVRDLKFGSWLCAVRANHFTIRGLILILQLGFQWSCSWLTPA